MMRLKPSKLVLASSSTYRLKLLQQIDLQPDLIVSPNVDESEHPRENPREYVRRVAQAKLDSVVSDYSDCCVIAADTVAVCQRKLLHKTEDIEQARRALSSLSGRRHAVYTCVCLYSGIHKDVRVRLVETKVRFKRLSDEELAAYLASGDWKNKAGCYGLQGLASLFIDWISGSFYNVVGLPLAELGRLLQWAGFGLYNPASVSIND